MNKIIALNQNEIIAVSGGGVASDTMDWAKAHPYKAAGYAAAGVATVAILAIVGVNVANCCCAAKVSDVVIGQPEGFMQKNLAFLAAEVAAKHAE